jgi:hypothetical protein
MIRIGRFLLPTGDPEIASYLFERLLAPHNLRERLRRSALLSIPGLATRFAARQPVPGPDLESVKDLLGGSRWILVEDYAGNGRERRVLFLFARGEASPTAVLKLATGSSLRPEREALRFLQERLSADLRSTVPRPIAWREMPGLEVLVMSALPGVSAYVEMQGLLAPGRAVRRHFEAAADWLARFHRTTGASHGDFWARNLLVAPNGKAAVVDWEHFSLEVPFHEDLFHFPLTYGLNYPWERWRRLPPEEAFRRTFLEDNRVSRAVAAYFAHYAERAGRAGLRRLFEDWLETRSEGDFRSLFGRAGRSVFSG